MAERPRPADVDFGAYEVPEAPVDFVDRTIAAAERQNRRRRRARVAAGALSLAAAAAFALWWRPGGEPTLATGAATARAAKRVSIGDRAQVRLDPGAAIAWRVRPSGAAVVDQSRGSARYRVAPGGRFRVQTPAGTIRVTGTTFRVEMIPMKKRNVGIAAAAGAAVFVVVHEGQVVLENQHGDIALEAGQSASATPASAPSPGAPPRSSGRTSTDRFETEEARDELLRALERARARREANTPAAPPPPRPVPELSSPGTNPRKPPVAPAGALDKQVIRDAMGEVRPLLAECYGLATHDRPDLVTAQHEVVVRFHIIAEPELGGLVDEAELTGELGPLARDATFSECLTETVYSLKLPPPSNGGEVTVRYPFVFRPTARADAGVP